MSKSWKEHLLKSGLPLENDIKRYLDSKGCVSKFEYSYLRRNEEALEKEFSYDIDASHIVKGNFIEFMVECKFRHETANWIFTPQEYGGYDEIYQNCFMHPFDHFIKGGFPFTGYFPEQLAPLCSKGVEVLTSGDNDKTITQAVSQLSYAFAPKIIGAIENQVDKSLVGDYIFYHIPVIATTANLYRLKETVDIDTIKSASNLDEIAEQYDCLVLKAYTGDQLRKYNQSLFYEFMNRYGRKKLIKALHSFNADIDFFFSVIADHYCPAAFVVVHYSKDKNGFDSLFNYLDRVLNVPEDLAIKLQREREESEARSRAFQALIDERKKKP